MAGAYSSYDCSQDLFEDEDETSEPGRCHSSSNLGAAEDPMIVKNLLKTANCSLSLKPLSLTRNNGYGDFHTICVEVGKYQRDSIPRPYPASSRLPFDIWDENHVRMPFSSKNCFPVNGPQGKEIRERWDLIREAYKDPLESSYDLENRIKSYNMSNWDFRGLHDFFKYHLDAEGNASKQFFTGIIPKMVELMMKTSEIMTQPLPLLKSGTSGSITFSQQQVAALLVNAFFCTFPRRNVRTRNDKSHEYRNYPDINFNRLFQNSSDDYHPEKLKCIFNYFRSVLLLEVPKGLVTFSRRKIDAANLPKWHMEKSRLLNVTVSAEGTIEEAKGTLQVDFANCMVGGGVLGHGCVQEEIRFLTCPELILSRLFTERLEDLEVLVVSGFQCFNEYKGYGKTFEFNGSHKDETPVQITAAGPRRLSYLVAMDALFFHDSKAQYSKENIDRELNKAFVAFDSSLEDLSSTLQPVSVATGNWGCGAFRGDPQLKSIIQMMAASLQKRHLIYFTFHDEKLETSIRETYDFLKRENISVGDLYHKLISFGEIVCQSKGGKDLFQYIVQEFSTFKVTDHGIPKMKTHPDKPYSSPKRQRKDSCKNSLDLNVSNEMELSDGDTEVQNPTKGSSQVFSQAAKAAPTGRLRFDETLEKSLPKIENGEDRVISDHPLPISSLQESKQRKDSQKSIREYFFKA